jgi:hypothetical protein
MKAIRDTIYLTKGRRYRIRVYGDTEHVSYQDTVRQAYDSSYLCTKCGTCDSIIYHTESSFIGLMPVNVANAYGVENTRDVVNTQYFPLQTAINKRISAYSGNHVTVNMSEKNADLTPAHFYTDTSAFKTIVHSIKTRFS